MNQNKETIILLGSDHAGFPLKDELKNYLLSKNVKIVDLGCEDEKKRVTYNDYADSVCTELLKNNNNALGILVCGTGIGMSIAANKYKNIRAALVHDNYTAKMARYHNNANILCMGARVIGSAVAKDIVDAFLSTEFINIEPHIDRVSRLNNTH